MAENYVNINNKVSFLLCFEVIKYGRVLYNHKTIRVLLDSITPTSFVHCKILKEWFPIPQY